MATGSAVKSLPTPIPKRASGSHFYKYSEFSGNRREWLRDIILTHRLYVPNLAQLNDPTDGRPKLAQKPENELFSYLYSGFLSRNLHLTVDDQIREGMVLDYNLKLHGTDVALRVLTKCLNEELSDWRIYSLSKRHDNLSLWATYAGNHSGYCLEFANVGPFFECAMEVSYGETMEMDLANPEHRNGYWFFCKRQEWSSEEEVRVLVPRKSACWVTIDPTWLRQLILGWKMPEADRKQIREWAAQRSPALRVVDASWDELHQVLRLAD